MASRLLKAALLVLNALTILNKERFLDHYDLTLLGIKDLDTFFVFLQWLQFWLALVDIVAIAMILGFG